MSGKKNQRNNNYPSWDKDETGESYMNSQNYNFANPADVGGASELVDNNVNGYANNRAGGARSNEGNLGYSSQPKRKANLGPWSQIVNDLLQNLEGTQQTIDKLQKNFIPHANDLEMMEDTKRRLQESEEACRRKDEEIRDQENAISTLNNIETRAMAKSKQEAAKMEKDKFLLEQEREKWEQDKEKQEKRLTMMEAEEKLKTKQEIERLTIQHDEIHQKRAKELELEFDRKRDEAEKRVKAVEAENKRLSNTVEKRDKKIEAQIAELDKVKLDLDNLQRAMMSVRTEKLDLEAKLETVEKEFALDTQPVEYFVRSFAEIEQQIVGISETYFHGIKGKDYDEVYEKLRVKDSCFESVPIDETDDSRNLCKAHAQRVISAAICEDIWRPFSSEFTTLQPEFRNLLGKISKEINKFDQGRRTAKMWDARTARALKSFSAYSGTSRDSKSTEYLHPERTCSVISKVFVLSPLVSSSQNESLRKDLAKLVNSAVDVWDLAQACGSIISINLSLDSAQREEWRSELDPACDGSETTPDLTSATPHRIYTLFPQVIAPRIEKLVSDSSKVPGSFPTDLEPKPIPPTIIHSGKGLPEWSTLVKRGQDYQKERQDYVKEALETVKKQFYSTRRASGSGRGDSRGSFTSGTQSALSQSGGVVGSPRSE